MFAKGGRTRLPVEAQPRCRAFKMDVRQIRGIIVSKPVYWALVLIALAAAGVTGCNTIRGVGEDVEAAGGALAGTAEKTEKELTKP